MGEHRCIEILLDYHNKYMNDQPEDMEINTRYLDFTTTDLSYNINEQKEALDSKEHNCAQLENLVSKGKLPTSICCMFCFLG